MKYKTLFRLAVKLIGVFFAAWGFVLAVEAVGDAIVILLRISGYQPVGPLYQAWWWIDKFSHIGGRVALGTFLFLFPNLITNLAIPSNRPYCPHCEYDLKGRERSRHCPECGVGLPAEL